MTQRLTSEQREQLDEWVAADYTAAEVIEKMAAAGWPPMTRRQLRAYADRRWGEIEEARQRRHAGALVSGVAVRAERIVRLCEHAAALERLKLQADEKSGRLLYEKAWRETLDDIAREVDKVGGAPARPRHGGYGLDKDYGDFDPNLV